MELKRKKKLDSLWKGGQTSQEDYRAEVHLYREKTCKVEAELELKLATLVLENKKGFSKHFNRKTRSKENVRLLLFEDSHLINRDEEQV